MKKIDVIFNVLIEWWASPCPTALVFLTANQRRGLSVFSDFSVFSDLVSLVG
jgi:hypothetical protein